MFHTQLQEPDMITKRAIKIEECLIFQKMSSQEQVLLSALDHLAK